jgi:carboxypeptidase Q
MTWIRTLVSALSAALLVGAVSSSPVAAQEETLAERYRAVADRIIDAALADSSAYERLGLLVDGFGHRFSGSESLERALDWILDEMRRDGLENVRGEEVMVPRWIRGEESAQLLEPRARALPMLSLGGSVGTPPEGITGEVLVVGSFEELAARASEAEGKIVLFNVPFTTYGQTVRYRLRGAVAAAQAGAVASMIRSVTPQSLSTPHTGAMAYSDTVPRIPHVALTVEDAALLQRLADRRERIVVRLTLSARQEEDVPSRNVMAELVGSERPEEVVVMGGHIDSWDVGQGAMDDGGGCVVAWEAVNLLRRLGLRPSGLPRHPPARTRPARPRYRVGWGCVQAARVRFHRIRRGVRHRATDRAIPGAHRGRDRDPRRWGRRHRAHHAGRGSRHGAACGRGALLLVSPHGGGHAR